MRKSELKDDCIVRGGKEATSSNFAALLNILIHSYYDALKFCDDNALIEKEKFQKTKDTS